MSLTDEDKNWIASAIASANAETEMRLGKLLTAKLDNLATREDLERVETSLLTEFHKWAGPMEQRMRSYREILRALDLETERLDERLAKLEPPRQQN